MMGEVRLSPWQAGVLLFLFGVGSSVMLLPSVVIGLAHQDAWISIILSMGCSFPTLLIYVQLARRFPGKPLADINVLVCGRWIGNILNTTFILYFLIIASLVLRDIGDLMSVAILPQTPMYVTHILFMIPVIYGVKLGIEVIARTGEIYFPWVILFTIIMVLFMLPKSEWDQLRPILADGVQPVLKGVYPIISFPIAEYAALLAIFPLVADRVNQLPKYVVGFKLFAGIYVSLLMVAIIAVEGSEIASRSMYAVYEMAKQVRIGRFLERLEVLLGLVWIMAIFVKLSILFYALNVTSARLLGLNDFRRIAVPLAMILLPISLTILEDPSHPSQWLLGVGPIYGILQSILIPLSLLIIAAARKLKS